MQPSDPWSRPLDWCAVARLLRATPPLPTDSSQSVGPAAPRTRTL